jgi:GntR family transcriptional regulator
LDTALLLHAQQRIRLGRMNGGGDLARAIADALREALANGELPAGTKLANEFVLAAQLQVSRTTLREAVMVLVHEGWLEVRRGIGTFAARRAAPAMRGRLDTMSSMTAAIAATGARPGVRDLRVREVAAQAEVAEVLEVAPGTMVARIGRTRLADDRPVAAAEEYVTLGGGVSFALIRSFDGTSLYEFARRRLGLSLAHSRLSLTAVAAPRDVAARLALDPGKPVLLMREVVFGEDGRPILYTVNHHNTAIVEFSLLRSGRLS